MFPDEVWQGPQGDFLRQLGLDPNDENNLLANGASISARLEEGKRRHEERNALAQRRVEARLAGAKVRPFFLIPDPCWQGPSGLFLMTTLELYPYDEWNVMYLAGDERTATALDVAAHPNGNIPAFVEASEKFMAEAQAHMQRAHDDASQTQEFGAYHEASHDCRDRVKTLAAVFAKQIVDAWAKRSEGRSM